MLSEFGVLELGCGLLQPLFPNGIPGDAIQRCMSDHAKQPIVSSENTNTIGWPVAKPLN